MIARGIVLQPEMSIDVEPDATTLYDLSRYRNNGTMLGAGEPDAVQLPSGAWVWDYDGTNDYITVPRHYSIEPAQITLWAWVYIRPSAPNAFGTIYDKPFTAHVNPFRTYILIILDANTATPDLSANFVIGAFADPADTVELTDISAIVNTWAFVVATFDQTTMYLDLNGGQRTASRANPGALIYVNTDLEIGRAGQVANRFFYGMIGAQGILSYALTPGQILNHYEKTKHWFGVHD